jgi:predicted  nucleic acid-binding Zn-ribbon protein
MSSAAGSVDVASVGATISGLAKREFVLRRAGKDQPEVFTSRWAMSYLRGPMTRDQISAVTAPTAGLATSVAPHPAPQDRIAADATPVAPKVADGIAVRHVDVAAPWLGDVGGDTRGTVLEAAVVARVAIRYDEAKADLVHDEEFEAVLFPLTDPVDVSALFQVDYDDRDLRTDAPGGMAYRLPAARIATKSFFNDIERNLRDHLTRNLSLEIQSNAELRLYGRPTESIEEFRTRCDRAADDRADAEVAALRDKYETKATKLRDQIDAAEDRAAVLAEEAKGKKTSEFFSTAGSMLGGLLGGRKSKTKMVGDLLGDAGTAARRRGSTSASDRRVDAAENKVQRLVDQYDELEATLEREVADISSRWDAAAAAIGPMTIGLERTDVKVTHLALAWIPVA